MPPELGSEGGKKIFMRMYEDKKVIGEGTGLGKERGRKIIMCLESISNSVYLDFSFTRGMEKDDIKGKNLPPSLPLPPFLFQLHSAD